MTLYARTHGVHTVQDLISDSYRHYGVQWTPTLPVNGIRPPLPYTESKYEQSILKVWFEICLGTDCFATWLCFANQPYAADHPIRPPCPELSDSGSSFRPASLCRSHTSTSTELVEVRNKLVISDKCKIAVVLLDTHAALSEFDQN